MSFQVDEGGLHRGDAGEDVEELSVPRGRNGAEEEELVHCGQFDGGNSSLKGRSPVLLCSE